MSYDPHVSATKRHKNTKVTHVPFVLLVADLFNEMVDLARFERATSTFAESRSYSTELQIQDSLVLPLSKN